MSEALRFNSDKPMMAYFMRSFPKMTEAVARVKEMGAIKYNDGNWKLGNKPDDEYWNSMFRHLTYIFGGEDYDKDTGCLHIAHAVWNLCALLELNYPDLPARDEEIWADRAVHWAEEKRKREAKETGSFSEGVLVSDDKPPLRWDDMDYQTQADMIASAQNAVDRTLEASEKKRKKYEAIEDAEGFGAAWAAYLIEEEEEKRKREAGGRENPRFVGDVLDMLFGPGIDVPSTPWVVDAECPMCDSNVIQRGKHGLECECGEIFEAPVVPENPENADADEIPQFTKMPKFAIPDGFSPVFSQFVRKIATRDDEVRSQYEAHCAEEKRKANAAFDATPYTTFIIHPGGLVSYVDECPMCGSGNVVLEGAGGMVCECGEIFGVPIVAENETTEAPQRNDATDAAIYAAGAADAVDASAYVAAVVERILKDLLLVECPMCGSNLVCKGVYGRECRECGEIFEVPIVAENAVSNAATPESAPIPKFIIKDADRSPVFTAFVEEYFYAPLRRSHGIR
jgi:hypothetical protein